MQHARFVLVIVAEAVVSVAYVGVSINSSNSYHLQSTHSRCIIFDSAAVGNRFIFVILD